MARKPKPPVERIKSGFRLNLQEEERELVLRLMGELRALLLGPNEDDRLRRLFPTAYHQPGDQAMDDEYQRLMREDLVASRLTGLNLVDECLSEASGDSAEAPRCESPRPCQRRSLCDRSVLGIPRGQIIPAAAQAARYLTNIHAPR